VTELERKHLVEADRHIAECKEYIAKQRERIERAIEQGRSTEVAETTLEALEERLRVKALAISIPGGEARYFQERMPYGLFVPDVR
jgi:hypothetical protein